MVRHVVITLFILSALSQTAFAQGPAWATAGQGWPASSTACLLTGATPLFGTGVQTGLGSSTTGTAGTQQALDPLFLGLGLGFGDGTQPQPLDGSGFGSPW